MKFKHIRALALCLVLATLVGAQDRANFPWWNSPVANDLGLTPQSQKIRQIVRAHRAALLDARNNVQKAVGDLDDLFNDPDVNVESAKPIIERLASARAEANRVFLDMSVQMRAVLTIEQWRQLVKRWDELQKKRPSETQAPPD
jgi:Spy/CpxP family protein refolding chaperone